MGQPEARIPEMGTLVLQPEYRAAHLSQEGCPVDLLLQLVGLQLLDGASQRAKRRHMGANALTIEAADSAVLRHQPGSTRRGGIEVVLQIQVRAAEIVDRSHRAAVNSESSPSEVLPRIPSTTTRFPNIEPSSLTLVSLAS